MQPSMPMQPSLPYDTRTWRQHGHTGWVICDTQTIFHSFRHTEWKLCPQPAATSGPSSPSSGPSQQMRQPDDEAAPSAAAAPCDIMAATEHQYSPVCLACPMAVGASTALLAWGPPSDCGPASIEPMRVLPGSLTRGCLGTYT
jgi:hypothetical protein